MSQNSENDELTKKETLVQVSNEEENVSDTNANSSVADSDSDFNYSDNDNDTVLMDSPDDNLIKCDFNSVTMKNIQLRKSATELVSQAEALILKSKKYMTYRLQILSDSKQASADVELALNKLIEARGSLIEATKNVKDALQFNNHFENESEFIFFKQLLHHLMSDIKMAISNLNTYESIIRKQIEIPSCSIGDPEHQHVPEFVKKIDEWFNFSKLHESVKPTGISGTTESTETTETTGTTGPTVPFEEFQNAQNVKQQRYANTQTKMEMSDILEMDSGTYGIKMQILNIQKQVTSGLIVFEKKLNLLEKNFKRMIKLYHMLDDDREIEAKLRKINTDFEKLHNVIFTTHKYVSSKTSVESLEELDFYNENIQVNMSHLKLDINHLEILLKEVEFCLMQKRMELMRLENKQRDQIKESIMKCKKENKEDEKKDKTKKIELSNEKDLYVSHSFKGAEKRRASLSDSSITMPSKDGSTYLQAKNIREALMLALNDLQKSKNEEKKKALNLPRLTSKICEPENKGKKKN